MTDMQRDHGQGRVDVAPIVRTKGLIVQYVGHQGHRWCIYWAFYTDADCHGVGDVIKKCADGVLSIDGDHGTH